MQQGGRLGCQNLLGLVDLAAAKCAQPGDLVQRQERVEGEEARDVGVLGVAPELPVVPGGQLVGIEPDRSGRCLAHLRPRRRGQKWTGQRVELRRAHAAAKVDAGDDVAPLVGAAHLQGAAGAAAELDEVVCLQAHVVEFDEGQLLLAVQPHLDAVHRQHAVDREVATDVAQEIDVVQLRQPFGIVDHGRVGATVAEAHEPRKDPSDAILVGIDLLGRQQSA